MIKRKLATLVAASFAGLMLSSPSFATDAQKAQTTSGSTTSAQTTASASGAPESRSIERADEKAAESNASGNSGTSNQTESERTASSQKADADAKADYRAAVEKCNALPTGQRDTCIQDAEAAQTLALEKNRDGTQASGAPEARSGERADDKAAKSDASSNTAMKNQTDSNTPNQTGAPESRVPGQQSKK